MYISGVGKCSVIHTVCVLLALVCLFKILRGVEKFGEDILGQKTNHLQLFSKGLQSPINCRVTKSN